MRIGIHQGGVGSICNLFVLPVLLIFWLAVSFGAHPAFGYLGGCVWGTLFLAILGVLFAIAIRIIPGWINLPIFIFLCLKLAPGGNYNVNFHTGVADKVAYFCNNDPEAIKAMDGWHPQGREEDNADYSNALSYNLKESWIWYNTYVNGDEKWNQDHFRSQLTEFYQWFHDHEYPKDGRPPMPIYFGTHAQIEQMRMHPESQPKFEQQSEFKRSAEQGRKLIFGN